MLPNFFVSYCLLFVMPPQYLEYLKTKQGNPAPPAEATFTNDTGPELTLSCQCRGSLDMLQGLRMAAAASSGTSLYIRVLATTVSQ